jgi:hypothetical protein
MDDTSCSTQPTPLVHGLSGRVQSLQLLPGKSAILLTLIPPNTISASEIIVRRLDSGEHRTVSRSGIEARYIPSGHIVYFDAGTLMAVSYDVTSLSVTGGPVPVVEAVNSDGVPGRPVNAAQFAISQTGTLAYMPQGADSRLRTLVWVDRTGRETSLDVPGGPYVYPRLSPDERQVVLTMDDQERDIRIWDVRLKVLRRFTAEPSVDRLYRGSNGPFG